MENGKTILYGIETKKKKKKKEVVEQFSGRKLIRPKSRKLSEREKRVREDEKFRNRG